jgi:hypothetical protein
VPGLDPGDAPAWCHTPWCFVDGENCDRPHHPSIDANSSYSYETCGYRDVFFAEEFAAGLINKTLRVSFPNVGQTDLFRIYLDADGQRKGSFLDFFRRVCDQFKIKWELVPLSKASQAYSPASSFTACVNDVAVGRTDVCVADFWDTPERRKLLELQGTFTAAGRFTLQ